MLLQEVMFQDEDGGHVLVNAATFRTILEQGSVTYRPGMTRVAFQDGTDRWLKATARDILNRVR